MKFLNSHLLNNNKSIIGQGFEKISVPMTTFKMKTIAAVLTQKGVGTVLCPKCNILNIVRDGRFRCHCGFTSNIIDCACDMCEKQLLDRDRQGKSHRFLMGHGGTNKDGSKRDGKYTDRYGYVKVLAPTYYRANRQGYVREHILVYEKYHRCCILPWSNVHHLNGIKSDNRPENLELMSKSGHSRRHHPKAEPGFICLSLQHLLSASLISKDMMT
jgi:hypothetical protein